MEEKRVSIAELGPNPVVPVKQYPSTKPKAGESAEEVADKAAAQWLSRLREKLSTGNGGWEIDMAGEDLSAWEVGNLDPLRFKAMVKSLGEGLSADAVARVFEVSPATVKEILATHPGLQTTIENYSLAKLKAASVTVCDRIAGAVDTMDPDKLPGAMRLIFDQIALLEGKPTRITEKTVRVINTNDLLEGLASADVEVAD